MRICYIASGASLHNERWLNYFARRGHEVHLITSVLDRDRSGLDNRIRTHTLVRLLPQIWKVTGYLSGLLWLPQVRRLVNGIDPDILHAHYVGVPAYLGVVSGFHPLVFSAWGSDILVDPNQRLLRGILTGWALRRADCIVCVSPMVRDAILRQGVNPASIVTTPVGVDTNRFRPGLRDEGLLRELGAAACPVVISTRSLSTLYSVETLIKAVPLVVEEMPETKFIVLGEGSQRSYLEGLAEGLGVTNSLRFVGAVPNADMPRYLASADLYVSTSLSDGASISLLEAFACALPAVVTDIAANRPWVVDGQSGHLIPPENNRKLAESILALLKDPDARNRFGELSRAMAVERADYDTEMSKMETMYEELRQGSAVSQGRR